MNELPKKFAINDIRLPETRSGEKGTFLKKLFCMIGIEKIWKTFESVI